MSVERTTCLGMGWIISPEKYQAMLEAAPEDKQGEIQDEFYPINSYIGDTDYFLGEFIRCIDEGDYFDLVATQEEILSNVEGFIDKYMEILNLCGESISPDSYWSEAHLYVIHRVW